MSNVLQAPGVSEALNAMVETAKEYLKQAAGRELNAVELTAFDAAREYMKANPQAIRDAQELFLLVDANLDRGATSSVRAEVMFGEAMFPSATSHVIDTGGHRTNAGRALVLSELEYEGRVGDPFDSDEIGSARGLVTSAVQEDGGIHVIDGNRSRTLPANSGKAAARKL